jgi:flagellar hook-associated protein 3 FlgL
MRISSNQIFQSSVRTMQSQQVELEQTQSQLSSGVRIQKPSDDPRGVGSAINLELRLEELAQYDRNGIRATTALNLQEQTLANASDVILRLREITLQGSSPSVDNAQRKLLGEEVSAQINILLSIANSRDGSGEYIFGGSRTDQTPFQEGSNGIEYAGSQQPRGIAVGVGLEIQVLDPGNRIFSSGGSDLVFATVARLQNALETSDEFDVEASRQILQELDSTLETLTSQRAIVGARLTQVEFSSNFNSDWSLQLKTALSETRDVDYAETISLLNQQVTALEAAQRTFVSISDLSLLRFLG